MKIDMRYQDKSLSTIMKISELRFSNFVVLFAEYVCTKNIRILKKSSLFRIIYIAHKTMSPVK